MAARSVRQEANPGKGLPVEKLPQPVKVPVADPKALPPGADPAAIAALTAGAAGTAVAGQLPAPAGTEAADPAKAEGADAQAKADEAKADEKANDADEADEEELEEGMIRFEEGETLESIKAKLKPKKSAISADLLDTANTYDDKVAIIRMLVAEDSGRVASVLKNMVKL